MMAMQAGGEGAVGRRGRRPPDGSAGRGPARATSAAAIYRTLREEILTVRRPPASPVVEKDIAARFGVSRTPVREALLRLADDGLVEVFAQSGTFVARIALEDLPEALAVRRVLEEATVRFAAERALPRHLADIEANLALQRALAAAQDHEGFHQADEAFHAALAEAGGHAGFWRLIQTVNVQVERYRRLTLPVLGRMGKVLAEHEAIAGAIAARDGEGAARALVRHLDDLLFTVAEARAVNPEYFVQGALRAPGSN